MKIFKLSALALASTLVLAGCGSDNDNTVSTPKPGVPVPPPVDNSLSEIDQAKEMIRTAKLFVSDNYAVKTAYENVGDILTDKQQNRFSDALSVPQGIYYYMEMKNLNKITAADINKLANNRDFMTAMSGLVLKPNSNFMATLTPQGKFELSGTTEVQSSDTDYIYNPKTNRYEETVLSTDKFTSIYDGYINSLTSNTSAKSFAGKFGFNSLKIGTGAEAITLTAANQGLNITGEFSDKVAVNDDFDLDETHDAGIKLEKATATLKDVKLVANDSVIEAKNLKFAILDVTNTLPDGSEFFITLPYQIELTGNMKKDKPATDVKITVNAKANEADLKKVIKLNKDYELEEQAGKFVGMDILLSLEGKVTKDKGAVIPLNFQANLKRTARDVIKLEGLTATVEGKTLFVEGQTNLNTDYSVKSSQLKVKQNNAFVILNVDKDNKFIKNSTGKLADIMVGNKDFGDLMDNKGKITAKFTDNSLIVL